MLLQRRAELHAGVLRSLTLERKHATELLGRREDDGGGGGEEGQVPHHRLLLAAVERCDDRRRRAGVRGGRTDKNGCYRGRTCGGGDAGVAWSDSGLGKTGRDLAPPRRWKTSDWGIFGRGVRTDRKSRAFLFFSVMMGDKDSGNLLGPWAVGVRGRWTVDQQSTTTGV